MEVDPELVVPDPATTLGEGAIQPWSGAHVADYFLRLLDALGEELGFDLDTPWQDLPAKARKAILDGHATRCTCGTATATAASASYYTGFEGVLPYIERRHREAESDTSRERFEGYMREVPVPGLRGLPAQAGRRWRSPSAARASPRSAALPIGECAEFLRDARAQPPARSRSPSGCSRRSTSG